MAYRSNILLGRIIKASGYKGAVYVKLEKNFTENIPDIESVFLEIEGRPVPFFIRESEYNGGDILKLVFDGYESVDKVSGFTGCKVFLTDDTPVRLLGEEQKSLEGYRVVLSSGRLLGKVGEMIFNSGQWLMSIVSPENKEILVPFHPDLVISIDNKNMIIVIVIPEGLTEIN
jgi:16S rRNA processing protein RimM